MLPELGHFALIVALAVAVTLGVLPLTAAQRGQAAAIIGFARQAAVVQALFVALAFGALMTAFARHDFSVLLVSSHSNLELPLAYRLAATWGSHEGSMLLWLLMLSGWTAAVAQGSRALPPALAARMLGVLGLLATGLLLFVLFTSNPFARLYPAALDGRDLNPLLQDPGMVLHPPMLYMGYVGFAVAFACAIGALLAGRLDAAWARWARPWTLAAWLALTLGIALGSWWAYYELGWGGWWFWDPVENASFMPWLVGTALVHSLAVTEKRGAFKAWTVLLAIAAFSLSLLGTFLVRSGVLTSVHAFATDPARGVFILALLALTVGGSLALFAARAGALGLGARFSLWSRESLLLANNLLLAVACAAVMLGTLYPLALDALGLGKISVGPPYFDAVFAPLMAPLLVLAGIGPLVRWKAAEPGEAARIARWPALLAVAAALALPAAAGRFEWGAAIGLLLAAWVLACTAAAVRRHGRAWRHAGLAFWGMVLAHGGLAVFLIGATMVRHYEAQRDVVLEVGEAVEVGGWRFAFEDIAEASGPNYSALRARIVASRGGGASIVLQPEKRVYRSQRMPMTEAAIASRVWGDLYVALGDPSTPRRWSVRLHVKPFVDWIWGGAALMALGALAALADRRRRRARTTVNDAGAVEPVAA